MREEIVQYEFGNFSTDKAGGGRLLDDIESKIIQMERTYNDFARTIDDANSDPASRKDFVEKWRTNIESAFKALTALASKKEK